MKRWNLLLIENITVNASLESLVLCSNPFIMNEGHPSNEVHIIYLVLLLVTIISSSYLIGHIRSCLLGECHLTCRWLRCFIGCSCQVIIYRNLSFRETAWKIARFPEWNLPVHIVRRQFVRGVHRATFICPFHWETFWNAPMRIPHSSFSLYIITQREALNWHVPNGPYAKRGISSLQRRSNQPSRYLSRASSSFTDMLNNNSQIWTP